MLPNSKAHKDTRSASLEGTTLTRILAFWQNKAKNYWLSFAQALPAVDIFFCLFAAERVIKRFFTVNKISTSSLLVDYFMYISSLLIDSLFFIVVLVYITRRYGVQKKK